ncbi:MAG TPA: NAD(P)/FAD-dependent oxidoreductase [Candidatus Sulfotelmatobacter sp.]|nr:NAD(P)/FAD-dependent oxidoreductase [Candidatus Sulfotelmatobacter sp.]
MSPHAPDAAPPGLAAHEARVARDLELLNLPARPWAATRTDPDGRPLVDVLVVGAGMCGIAAAAGLLFRGIPNIRVLDRNSAGREGPWLTFARMETLRSPKQLPGPALGVPSLTFRAWYEAIHGAEAWRRLYKIARATWMDYLGWLQRVLRLPIENDVTVTRLEPLHDMIAVTVCDAVGTRVLHARRVVLATGRGGAGGLYTPDFVDRSLWPDLAAHANEAIDFTRLAGRRIAVLGGGDAAWDNAATALEAGAARVDMYVRRPVLPQVNKGRGAALAGFFVGIGALDDADRWAHLVYRDDHAPPPPHETVLRTLRQPAFHIHLATPVVAARRDDARVALRLDGTSEPVGADFLIVATGFQIDLATCPELAALAQAIATWGDRHAPPAALERPHLARYPYLGPGFELQPRTPSDPPALARIHLFNFGATASHGALTGEIPGVDIGAARLTDAIAAAIFREDLDHMRRQLDAFAEPELEPTPFFAPEHLKGTPP